MIRTIVLVCLLACAAQGQDCADWTATMPPPVEYPEILTGDVAVVGDLLVTTRPGTITIHGIAADHQLIPVGSADFEGSVTRIRVLDGELYMGLYQGGLLHVDLEDPENPVCEPVFHEEWIVHDLTPFDGGYAIATGDTVFAVDTLDGLSPEILSAVALEALELTASGAHVFAGGSRLSIVDFTDAEAPIVELGEGHHPGGELYLETSLSGLVVHGDQLFLKGSYHHYPSGATHSYNFAFDLSLPMDPAPTIVRGNLGYYGSGPRFIMGPYLVESDHYASLEFLRLDNLETAATVPIGAVIGNPAAHGDQIFVKATHDGTLHRLDCSPVGIVQPLRRGLTAYDPMDCGDIGYIERTVYEHDFMGSYEDSVGYLIYDQSEPMQPEVIQRRMWNVGHDDLNHCYRGSSCAAYNDDWVVVDSWENCDWYVLRGLRIEHRGSWESALIQVEGPVQALLDGDVLWVHENVLGGDRYLSTYQLTPGSPTLLDEIQLPDGDGRMDLWHDLSVSAGEELLIFDRNTPENLTVVEQHSIAPVTRLLTDGLVCDGILYSLVDGGMAAVDLQAASPGEPALRSMVAHEVPFISGLSWNGDLAMVHGRSGYQVIDTSDPDDLRALTGLVALDARSAVWNGDHLYAAGFVAFELYDLSNPSAPQWLGQAEGEIGGVRSCVKRDLLLMGGSVYPLDCADPTSMEEEPHGQEPDLPRRAVLHPASPNPFNPQTTLRFTLAAREHVELVIFDLRGRRVAELLSRACEPGIHRVSWDGMDRAGRALSSGTYVARLRAGEELRSQKLVLVR